MKKGRAEAADEAALVQEVLRLNDQLKLSVERALRRAKEADCTDVERKKIRAALQRSLDRLNGVASEKKSKVKRRVSVAG